MVREGYALVSQVFGAPALTPTVGGTSYGNLSTTVQNFLYFLLGGKDIYAQVLNQAGHAVSFLPALPSRSHPEPARGSAMINRLGAAHHSMVWC